MREREKIRDITAAPILLVLARVLQGLSVGGEFGSSATYLSEVATPGKRGFFSSFQYVSIIIGAVAGLGVMILRRTMDESEHYKIEKARNEAADLQKGAMLTPTENGANSAN